MTSKIRGRRAGVVAAVGLCGLGLAVPASVSAARDYVRITTPPSISGSLVVGQPLQATGATWEASSADPSVSYRWIRCADAQSWRSCSLIPGASGSAYTLTDADAQQHMAVWLQVTSGRATANALSPLTGAVAPRPPTPAPTPTPTSTPTPTPTDIVPPDVTTPAPPTTGGVAGEHAHRLRWLKPFPVVRIKGWLTATGARVTLLTVRAPRRAAITVRCTGRGCPRRHFARATALVHLRPYQRLLRGRMRLEISVTRRGYVGKRTVIWLRPGKPPARSDLCLYPGSRRAKACTR